MILEVTGPALPEGTIPMNEMKAGDAGVVVGNSTFCDRHVYRDADDSRVIDFAYPGSPFLSVQNLPVRLLKVGEEITIKRTA